MGLLEAAHWELLLVIILFLIVAAGYAAFWAVKRKAWSRSLGWGYWLALIFIDVQLALGAALWIAAEGWNQGSFISVLHPLGMITAAAVAHIAVIRASRSQSSKAFIGVGISMLAALAVIVVSVPPDAWQKAPWSP